MRGRPDVPLEVSGVGQRGRVGGVLGEHLVVELERRPACCPALFRASACCSCCSIVCACERRHAARGGLPGLARPARSARPGCPQPGHDQQAGGHHDPDPPPAGPRPAGRVRLWTVAATPPGRPAVVPRRAGSGVERRQRRLDLGQPRRSRATRTAWSSSDRSPASCSRSASVERARAGSRARRSGATARSLSCRVRAAPSYRPSEPARWSHRSCRRSSSGSAGTGSSPPARRPGRRSGVERPAPAPEDDPHPGQRAGAEHERGGPR